jgi:hypothetical protein
LKKYCEKKTCIGPIGEESAMSLRRAAAAFVVLAVTAVFGQENAPASAPAEAPAAASQPTQRPTVMRRWGKNTVANKQPAAGPVNAPSLQQHVQDMQATVDKMHEVLTRMQKKTVASAKDPVAKANLQMWQLMVAQLDKQLQDLKLAEASRQEMEVRRQAMYKQAEVKSQAAARAGQQAMFSQQPTGTVTTPPAGQGAGAQAPAVQTAAPVAAPNASANPSASPK